MSPDAPAPPQLTQPSATSCRPRSVGAAVFLLATSWTLGVTIVILSLELLAVGAAGGASSPWSWALAVLVVLYYCFLLWLIVAIGRRHTWPRFVLLALTLLTCISMLLRPGFYFGGDVAKTGFNVTQLALQGVALGLLFSRSARQWCQKQLALP